MKLTHESYDDVKARLFTRFVEESFDVERDSYCMGDGAFFEGLVYLHLLGEELTTLDSQAHYFLCVALHFYVFIVADYFIIIINEIKIKPI